MKTKIQIKSIFGKLIFEFEKENNSIKETLIEAIKSGSDLRGSDLSGSNLSGSNLSSSNLSYSNLRGSNLRGSNLSYSNLSYSNLSGSNLRGSNLSYSNLSYSNLSYSNLRGSDLSGSDLRGSDLSYSNLRGSDLSGIKIKKAVVLSGLYQYIVIPFISEDNTKYVKMGCYTRSVKEWKTNFWNNPNEFPNNDSEKSNLRLFAFETALKWLEIIEKQDEAK